MGGGIQVLWNKMWDPEILNTVEISTKLTDKYKSILLV